uniref:Uncharacterized protein n=1 Tax=Rhabditophanes sp. KR3021 TaxID=114890 RepID=A0AC35U8F3_9BILA
MHYYGNVSQEDYSNYQSEPANNYIPVPTPYMPLQTNQNGAVRNYPTNYYYSGNNASTGESTQQVSAVPSQQLPMQSSSPTRLSQHVKSNDYYPFNGSSQYASNDLRSYVSLESCQQDKPCTCSLPDHQYQAKCQKHSNLKSSVYQNTPRTVVDEVDNKAAATILQVTPSKDLRTTQKQLSEGKKSYDSTPSFDESGVRSVSIRTVHFMLDKILEEEGLSGHSTNKT